MNKLNYFKIGLIFYLTVLSSCNNSEDINFEKNTYNQIINDLLRETVTDYRNLIIPNPSSTNHNEKLNNSSLDNDVKFKEPLIIGLNDTINRLDETAFLELVNNKIFIKKKKSILNIEYINKKSYKIESDYFYVDKNLFLLQAKSKMPNEKIRLSSKNWRNYGGILNLSRIYFNKDKSLGIFKGGFYTEALSGFGFIALIEKVNHEWKIIEIIETSIS